MSIQSRTFALLLAMTPGIGGRSVTRVLTRNGLLSRTPDEFLEMSPATWKEEYKLAPKAIAHLQTGFIKLMEATIALEHRLDGLGVSLITAADAHYPQRIESMDPDPPGVLFLYGNTKLLEADTFCALSSRDSSPGDLALIERLTEEAMFAGKILVTSHDNPEYQASAIVPLRWGSPRVLCLDRGMFNVLGADLKDEAFAAARLWRYEFDPHTDLVVSPFRPDAAYVGVNNQVRDRLVGCLSLRLEFVKITSGGNMEKLAQMALKAGRDVLVSKHTSGYKTLVKSGAKLIEEKKLPA